MHADTLIGPQIRGTIDSNRYIHLFTAALFLLTAVVGFAPRSAAILAGAMPNPPLVVHVHAALMSTWLLLLVLQTALVASTNRKLHMRLGLASTGLAAAMLATMIPATLATYRNMTAAGVGDIASNLLLLQLRAAVLFPLFFLWGMRTRRSAPQTHKRMMLLATFIMIDAAIGRMDWLPGNNTLLGYDMAFVYQFLLLLPALLHDKFRNGRIHQAWLQGLGIYLPWVVATSLLWNSPWWLATAPALMGY